jgi:molecular chaperone GrpE
MEPLKLGIYRHYKGGEYRILGEARLTDQEQKVVVYQSLRDDQLWVRPLAEFCSKVEVGGETKPRFEFLREEAAEAWEDKYKRALADYQNLLKQTAKEKSEFTKYALTDFLHNVLPIYDHLKLSLEGLSDAEAKNPWAQGVKYVLKQFKEVLTAHGIEEIKTVGEPFDQETMEAVDGSGDQVKQEIMPGYRLHGKLLRAAKVIVE